MTDADLRRRFIRITGRKRLAASLVAATAALARGRNQLRRAAAEGQENILVLEPFGLGDVISFEPLVRSLRAQGRNVIFCAKPEWRPLFPEGRGLEWLDVFLPWATHNEEAKYRLRAYFRAPWRESLRRLRKAARGAIGLDTRGDIRSVWLLQHVGCKRVISLDHYLGSDLIVPAAAAEHVPFTPQVRRWELNAAFLEPLGFGPMIRAATPPFLAHLARPKTTTDRIVGLMPVAPWRGKLWFPERWREVIQQLRKENCTFRVLCGPGQRELAQQQTSHELKIVECGSIESWAQHFTACSLVITLDSGPMHLADALAVPVIALFGQGWLPFWAPSGRFSRVLAHQDDPDFAVCHPVEENTPLGQKYMARIQVSEVVRAVQETFRALEQPAGNAYVHATPR